MNTETLTMTQSTPGADWATYYSDLEKKGNVPDAACKKIDQNNAVFRGMAQNLSEIKQAIRVSGYTPSMTTIYADVLVIPNNTTWVINSQGLIIYARQIVVEGNASIILDYENDTLGKLIVFGNDVAGSITIKAVFKTVTEPQVFEVSQADISPGLMVSAAESKATVSKIDLKNGFALQLLDDMKLYLDNSFIFGSLLYDQNAPLAVSIFTWIKGWAAQNKELQELFYRSTSLATLLNSELNAEKNGAKFVPYLTSNIYTKLASAFAAEASKYESDYLTLSTQEVLTKENIAMAKTMVQNSQSEIDYVNALLAQANENYDNAETAAKQAKYNFNTQQRAVDMVAIDFKEIGIPAYQRKVILEGILDVVKAVVTFGGAIALMAVGDEAAAPAAAEGAVEGVEAVSKAATTAEKVAKLAADLAETMKKLKKLVEALQKVYDLAKAVKDVADNISTAESKTDIIQKMNDTTDGADLSAADGWRIFQIQADNAMEDPISLGIEYAKDYNEAMDILVVYGQSLSAAQLAVIKTSQAVAALVFQLHYAKEKQANFQKLVDGLEEGDKASLSLMQTFYQKYLNSKSSLFAALKSYQDSYFYWALMESNIQPKIIDSVDDLNSGIHNLTTIAMDEASALEQFNPPPQKMKNMTFSITDEKVLKDLRSSKEANWVLPLMDQEFAGLDRVRLNDMRVWLEGVDFSGGKSSVFITITNTGNYLDRYKDLGYQFNSKGLTRTFEYKVSEESRGADWTFGDGSYGFVQIDGVVDHEVAYAYFRPTPFAEWKISVDKNNSGVDFSKVTKITMYFAGSAIGTTSTVQGLLTKKTENV